MTAQDTDPLVLFMPSGKRGRFAVGTPLLDAARELGVYVESVCGGRATCGRCQIEVQEGSFAKHKIVSTLDHISPMGPKERRYAEKRELAPGRRLSCSATVQGDLVVDVPQDTIINAQVVRKSPIERVIERNPAVQLCYVEVEEPDMHHPLGDLDRLKAVLEKDWGWEDLLVSQHLLPKVQSILRRGELGRDGGDPPRPGLLASRPSSICGRASTTRPTASPATSARPRLPCTWCRFCLAVSQPPRASPTRRSASARI